MVAAKAASSIVASNIKNLAAREDEDYKNASAECRINHVDSATQMMVAKQLVLLAISEHFTRTGEGALELLRRAFVCV